MLLAPGCYIGDPAGVAGSAVREGGICVVDDAVGSAVGAGYGIRRRAGAGEAQLGEDGEQQELHYCPLSVYCSHDPERVRGDVFTKLYYYCIYCF